MKANTLDPVSLIIIGILVAKPYILLVALNLLSSLLVWQLYLIFVL